LGNAGPPSRQGSFVPPVSGQGSLAGPAVTRSYSHNVGRTSPVLETRGSAKAPVGSAAMTAQGVPLVLGNAGPPSRQGSFVPPVSRQSPFTQPITMNGMDALGRDRSSSRGPVVAVVASSDRMQRSCSSTGGVGISVDPALTPRIAISARSDATPPIGGFTPPILPVRRTNSIPHVLSAAVSAAPVLGVTGAQASPVVPSRPIGFVFDAATVAASRSPQLGGSAAAPAGGCVTPRQPPKSEPVPSGASPGVSSPVPAGTVRAAIKAWEAQRSR